MRTLYSLEDCTDSRDRYKWATQPSPITLGGDEKQIHAYGVDEKSFDDAVVPAISDL